MLKNNNNDAIKRLTRRSVASNRVRNTFAIIAIILTSYMIATLFSIGISFGKNLSVMNNRIAGTLSSITVLHPTEQQIEAIRALPSVQQAGVRLLAGEVYAFSFEQMEEDPSKDHMPIIHMAYLDQTEYEKNVMPCISGVTGAYPQAADEIMLSENALKNLGIQAPKIGMQVPITYLLRGQEITEVFTLSGFFTDYADFTDSPSLAMVSKAYCDANGITMGSHGSLCVTASLYSQKDTLLDIMTKTGLTEEQTIETAFDPAAESAIGTLGAVSLVVMIALFIILSGYLLIYNIIYISVTKDTRYYGLLKTLGTSPRQIKQIVRNQIYLLSFIGIPIGLGLAAATSFLLVPYTMKTIIGGMALDNSSNLMPTAVSFHPSIFILTALLTWLTIALASRQPAKLAARISPVDAMNYTGMRQKEQRHDRRSTKGGKPYRMAWHNIFREKKRAILVFASLFMGTVTFLSVHSFLNSIHMENYLNNYFPDDFLFTNTLPLDQNFTPEFIEELSGIRGVEKIETVESETILLDFNAAVYRPFLSPFGDEDDPAYLELVKKLEENPQEATTFLQGIDFSHVEQYNKKYQTSLEPQGFESGDYCLLGFAWPDARNSYLEMVGKEITLRNPVTGRSKTMRVAGILTLDDSNAPFYAGTADGLPEGVFVSHAVMRTIFPEPTVTKLAVQVNDRLEPSVRERIRQLAGTIPGTSYRLEIRSELSQKFNTAVQGVNVLTGGISLLLILIGLINFVNVMLTGVYIRRKELAVLESIGMTKKQIRKMLTFEGLYYALLTSGLILTLGHLPLWFLAKNITRIADYAVFEYPYMIMIGILSAIFVVCLSVPALVFRALSKASVTARLHDKE